MTLNPFRISRNEALFAEGEILYIHDGKETHSGAYEINEKAKIKIKIPRAVGLTAVSVDILDDSHTPIVSINAEWSDFQSSYDVYALKLPIKKLGSGLFFFEIRGASVCGEVYASPSENGIRFSDSKAADAFQISVSDFKYKAPKNHLGGIIYHIFVDRFARGERVAVRDGGVFVDDWNAPLPEYPKYPGAPLKNNYFYGGNLYGIIDKLDYIKSLGVTVIYLSPIFESVSNHKYDTADYMSVDSAFGGEEGLSALIEEAGKLGISIILDGVFNHTGADSIYFNKFSSYDTVGAYQSKDSKYYSWYDFKSYPDKYTSWWDIEILPRINPNKAECREYFVGDRGVIEKYMDMGILGFRLDVVDELSNSFTEAIKKKMNDSRPDSVLYGEVWEDASNKIAYGKRKQYYLGKQLDGVMNYPLREGLIDYLTNKNTEKISYALTDIIFNAPKRIRDMQMNLIGTHDTERIITALGAESPCGKDNDYLYSYVMTEKEYKLGKRRVMSAYTALATLPGIPAIFYGDEAGLQGYKDPFNRRTFPWDKVDLDLLSHYRLVGKIRGDNEVYASGDFKLLHLDKELLIFARYDEKHAYITVINNSESKTKITLSMTAFSLADMKKSREFILEGESSSVIKVNKKATLEF